MNRNRVIAIADRTAPHALKLIAIANLMFLASVLGTLSLAVEIAQR